MCDKDRTSMQKCPKCNSKNTEDVGNRFGSGPSIENWKNETWKCNDCGEIFYSKEIIAPLLIFEK